MARSVRRRAVQWCAGVCGQQAERSGVECGCVVSRLCRWNQVKKKLGELGKKKEKKKLGKLEKERKIEKLGKLGKMWVK